MKIIKFLLPAVLIGFFLSQTVFASLQIELTQARLQTLPIAIMPFADQDDAVSHKLRSVIQADLQNSGQFRVIDLQQKGNLPHTVEQVDFRFWQTHRVNQLVVGRITAKGSRYQVSFQLVNIFNGFRTRASQAVSVQNSFTVSKAGIRELAHHISDLIYQHLTGVRGVFATRIAYVLVQHNRQQPPRYKLEVADADGHHPQALLVSPAPIMSPAWSPDGRELAYVSFENHHASIYLQNIYTGERRVVSDAKGINGAPAFSPDGKNLALVLSKTGNPKIYLLNLATKQLRQLTHGWSIDTEPAYAPDGKSLLFTSNRGGTPQIYRYNLADATASRLTFSGNYNARASFVPGNNSIVMMHRTDDLFGIFKKNLSNDALTLLTQSGNDESPSVAPNGQMVIYATQYGGHKVLGQVSIDGKVTLRLPAEAGNVEEPAWSPFLNSK